MTSVRAVRAVIGREMATEDDFQFALQVRNSAFEMMARQEPIDAATFRKSVAAEPPLIYEADGTRVGFGSVSRWHDGYVYASLAVHADHRRRGYGTAIYRDLRSRWPATEDVRAICRQENAPSIAAGLKAGYVIDRAHDVGPGMTVLLAKATATR